ncbi:hypothetical protein [Kibdelosporangium persicum]|nr:hypothetical protein [Kibdelosporangium persicum]
MKLAAVGAALAMGALLSACSGQGATAPTETVPKETGPKETGQAAPKAQQLRLLAGGDGKGDTGKEVNCSTNGGTVGPHQVDLIAVETEAGIVGCTEAFTVVTEYFENAGESEGTARSLTVQGWQCMTDTGAHGTGSVACTNDKLFFYTSAINPSTRN